MPDIKPKAARTTSPSWSDVKAKLASFDHADLIGLVQALYVANKDNQAFLHARFTLGSDVLEPYKVTIDRWLWPDAFKDQGPSVAKAKKAISDYRKAIGQSAGIAELMVFCCERASGFSADIGYEDDGYFDALVRMFEQSLKTIAILPDAQRPALWARLDEMRRVCQDFGYGVADDMDNLLAEYGVDGQS